MKRNHHWLLFSNFWFKHFWKMVFKFRESGSGFKIYGNANIGYYVICDNGITYKIYDNKSSKSCYTIYVYHHNEFLFHYDSYSWQVDSIVGDNPLTFAVDEPLYRIIKLSKNTTKLLTIQNSEFPEHYTYMEFSVYGRKSIYFAGFNIRVISKTSNFTDKKVLHDQTFYIFDNVFYKTKSMYYIRLFSLLTPIFNIDLQQKKLLDRYCDYSTYKYFKSLHLLSDDDDMGLNFETDDSAVGYSYRLDDHIYYMLIDKYSIHYRIFTNGFHEMRRLDFHGAYTRTDKSELVCKILKIFFTHSAMQYPATSVLNKLELDGHDLNVAKRCGLTEEQFTVLEMIDL